MPYGKIDGYTLTKKLGSGMSCEVFLGQKNGQQVAVKVLDKKKMSERAIRKLLHEEVKGQTSIGVHKNVTTIFAAEENAKLEKSNGSMRDVAYIVMEYINGGELMDLLIDNGGFSEDISRYFFRQMLRGISHCHQNGLSHRDLKPENMLVTTDNTLKICDFGFAISVQGRNQDGLSYTPIGTPAYMDSEIFKAGSTGRGYNAQKADLYALGVILFIIVFGTFPLDEAKETDSYFKAMNQNNWDTFWRTHEKARAETGAPKISNELRELISMMIQPAHALRPTLADIIVHPWTQAQSANEQTVEAEVSMRRNANKARAGEQVATQRFNDEPCRDFKLNNVTYYEELDNSAMANDKNVQLLKVSDYDPEVMDYRQNIDVNVQSDMIFTQIKSLLNTLGVSDSSMKMSKKSWKLKVEAERVHGQDEENEEEAKTEEGQQAVLTEKVCMQLEVLNRDGKKQLFAKKNGGSFKYYQYLWDQVRENVLLQE